MKKFFNNERGISLIEVVASIVLITIILLSFFNIFIQSAKHTKFNEEKLTSVEIAEDLIANIRKIPTPSTYKNNISKKEVSSNSDYSVLVTIVDGPTPHTPQLKKATIEVTPVVGKGIKKSTFITHIYYEVAP